MNVSKQIATVAESTLEHHELCDELEHVF